MYRTVTRFYRGRRIRAIQLGSTWHASVRGRSGSIVSINSPHSAIRDAEQGGFIERSR
jgi:hypothetical protein